MAAPTIPLEIWAASDVVLPNTHELNKSRPINDLWTKGWDMGEKPACEEFNYVLNMITQWGRYVTGEQIPGLDTRFLRIANNLSDVPNKATARTNLDVYSKAESDARYVNVTGDTMSGTLSLPRLDFQASSSDSAFITTTNPASDWTYFDFNLGDNPGTAGASGVDVMRFRFTPSGSAAFSMMELNATGTATALCRVIGNITATATITGATVTATTLNGTNGTVSGTLTVGTLQSTTTRATNVIATAGVSCATLTATTVNGTNGTISGTLTVGTLQSTTTRATNVIATAGVTGATVTASSSMTTPSIRVNGLANVNSLSVVNNSATVAGKNIVRSVNSTNADANGNVVLTINSGVMDLRLGAQVYQDGGGPVPAGHVVTWVDGGEKMQFTYAKPLQKLVNGVWSTITG